MKYPIATFAPDLPPNTPGILVDCDGVYPSDTGGLRAFPSASPFTEALDAAAFSAFNYQDNSQAFRTYAAIPGFIYQLNGTAWEDVSGSTSYANVTKWCFAGWGDWILATDMNCKMQVQTDSLDPFADLSGSPPEAAYMIVVKNFVVTARQSSYPARVQWCAQGDATDWTPSLTTQAGYSDLIDSSGPITGIRKLGDGFVVFKEKAMYYAYYVGAPYVWAFQKIPTYSGCLANWAIVELEGAVFYPGVDDFYLFDGTFPKRIGKGVRDWFFASTINKTYMINMTASYDQDRNLIFWFYPTGTDTLTDCLVYDVKTQRWGKTSLPIETNVGVWRTGITYATVTQYFADYKAMTDSGIPYNSPFWSSSTFQVGVFNGSHVLCLLNGTPGTATMTTDDIGNQARVSRIGRVWPYFSIEPTSCAVKARGKTKLGGTATESGTSTMGPDGDVDLDWSAKYLSLDMTLTGDWDFSGFDAEIKDAGGN